MAREQRFDELDPIVQEDRDAVTRPHAAAHEHGGEARSALVKLGVRPRLVTEDEREVVRMSPARPAGELWQHQPA